MRLRLILTALVILSVLLLGSNTVSAAYSPAAEEAAGNRMLALQMLKGKYADDALALRDEITRAELVTVIVRAFGQETNAALLNGAAAYPDTAAHWASGNIAMAKALVEKAGGDAIGMPDGSFAPDSKLTPAQAVAFLMKFLGVKADAAKAWPKNYLDVAVDKSLITAEDAVLFPPMTNDNATRGLVFYLFDRAFAEYDLGAGKTFYTQYVDTVPPVLTVNAPPWTTLAAEVTLTGKAEGATTVHLLRDSDSTAIAMDANGNWSVSVTLSEGENHLVVRAADLANNLAEKTVTIQRQSRKPASLQVKLPATVAVGSVSPIEVTIRDQAGEVMREEGWQASVKGGIGQVDPAAATFTAVAKPGQGAVEITAGDLKPVSVPITVTHGPAVALKITPEELTAFVGAGPFTFTAQGEDQYGNLFDVDPAEIDWSEWDDKSPGTQRIRAAMGDAEGTAALTLHTRPTVTAGNRTSTTGDFVSMRIAAADADGDRLSYAATGLPAGLSVDPATGLISGRVSMSGTYQVTVTVTDQDDESASASFTWWVNDPYVPEVRRPASFTAEMPTIVEVGSVSQITVIINDQFGDPMPAGWQASVTGGVGTVNTAAAVFTAATVPGQGSITVTVGNLAPRIFEVAVMPGPATALQITPLTLSAFVDEGPFTFTAKGEDQYGNLFEIDAAAVLWDPWSESSPGTQRITATMGEAQGTATLTLHTRPRLSVEDQSGIVGADAFLELEATDADGDRLTYAVSGLPEGLALNPETGSISGQFTASGTYEVTVTVEDEDGAEATATFTWTVAPAQAANQPPVVNGPATFTTPPNANTVFGTDSTHRIAIADSDAGAGELEVTIATTAGRFSLWPYADLTFISGPTHGVQSLTFRGTLEAINRTLDGVLYHAAERDDVLSITLSDLGNTGIGGVQTASLLIEVMLSAGE